MVINQTGSTQQRNMHIARKSEGSKQVARIQIHQTRSRQPGVQGVERLDRILR